MFLYCEYCLYSGSVLRILPVLAVCGSSGLLILPELAAFEPSVLFILPVLAVFGPTVLQYSHHSECEMYSILRLVGV